MLAFAAMFAASLAFDAGARSSVSPPRLQTATIDGQRRLVVSFAAPDGVNYGGHVYLDNDPRNTQLSGDPAYGQFMYCNNKGTCLGRWSLPTTSSTGPQTFTTPALDMQRFPPGTYYVQVETTNNDPFSSTRQWENSNVLAVELPAAGRVPGRTPGSGQTGTSRFLGPPGGPSTVRWSGRVLVSKNGIAEAVEGGEFSLPPGVGLNSESRAVQLAIREGRLVLGKQSALRYRGPGSWEVYGDAWFSVPGGGRQLRLVVAANVTTTIRVVSPAVFAVDTDANDNARVQVYKGTVSVRNGFDPHGEQTTLNAGFELLVPSVGPSTKPPRKLKPPAKPFWR